MARRAAFSLVALGVFVWALWSGCGKGSADGTRAQTDAAVDAADAVADSASEPGDVMVESPGDTGLPYAGAEPCGWPGWYRAPILPKGCRTVCIPDDVKVRVPALKWVARDDWCPGCEWLAPGSWADGHATGELLFQGLSGLGAGPDLFELAFLLPDGNVAGGMYDAQGAVVFAMRLDKKASPCWWADFASGGDNETVGVSYEDPGGIPHWFLRPKAAAGQLMLATEPTFAYDAAFTSGQSTNAPHFTANWIVDEFYSFHALVNLKTKQAVRINDLPGAPSGEYDDAAVVGDTVFFARFASKKLDWWVIPDAKNPVVQPFVGAADVQIDRFATDGTWIVWNEGTNFKPDGGPDFVEPQMYNLYRAPFTTDPSKLQRQLLVPNTHQFYGFSTLANGIYTDMFFQDTAALKSSVYVVEVATGRAWVSNLPGNYFWGKGNYPTATELWGTIMPNGYSPQGATELARVPYAAMQQIQSGLP